MLATTWIGKRDGTMRMVPRDSHGFHYSSLPTADHLREFGYLSFICTQGTAVALFDGENKVLPRTKLPFIVTESGEARSLPPEVLKVGNAKLTSHIYDGRFFYPDMSRSPPDESFLRERERQRREIVKAVDRVCELSTRQPPRPDALEACP